MEVVLLSDYEKALEYILELNGTDVGAPVITLEDGGVFGNDQIWRQRIDDDARSGN